MMVGRDQDIGCFDIAVYDALFLKVDEGFDGLTQLHSWMSGYITGLGLNARDELAEVDLSVGWILDSRLERHFR